ncbi:hypothetical protein [Novosphingopyxis sp. YJ-S2-01]|uniref:hypothetical protein n=1 Tax=Novosphingopyxis sp. YJ-S2-01 TaxID=2794021 RepID=UPI0018DEB29E|nr:hypothetical protein [Novosphingopyxis sp. YJ-S2-01]MBH9538509.1 hypothetical protein [Novosphingopyxis sp. YJ-S2-01]
MRHFAATACIDWSGQAVARPKGLAVAIARADGPPALIEPESGWTRGGIFDWLRSLAKAKADIVIGLDLSPTFPFLDTGAYFPGWSESPADPRALWALVERIAADDPHMSANSFVDHPEASRYFRRHGGREGDRFGGGIGRLREVERHQRATGQANSWSCFNLVGAGQVGKSSLTGMRMLHALDGAIPFWPCDPVPDEGPLLIEIYTSLAARAAGLGKGRSKVRDAGGLRMALTALGSPDCPPLARYDDHATDALITAAWLREAVQMQGLWSPQGMSARVAQLEGWTFGIR